MKIRNVMGGVSVALLLCFVLAATALAGAAFVGDKVERMDTKVLLSLIDSPDILIIDVRRGSDWKGSELMIKNAVRKAYDDVDGWVGSLPKDKMLVLYCT